MPDSTIAAIDRIFDFIDKGVDAADHALNRGKHTAEQHRARGARPGVIEAEASPSREKAPRGKAPVSQSKAVARRPHFYIVEKTDPHSGATIYVVTDGGNARTECGTREFATAILRALEAAP